MTALLIVCALVVIILASVASVVARRESNDGKPIERKIEAALAEATEGLDEAQNDDLGAPVINARMSGLVEFVHGLTSVRDSERRTNMVPFLLVLAGVVVLAGATIAIVDRVEERREHASCVNTLANLRSSPANADDDQTDEALDPGVREGEDPADGEAEDPADREAEDPGDGEAEDPADGEAEDPADGEAEDPADGEAEDPADGEAADVQSGTGDAPDDAEQVTDGPTATTPATPPTLLPASEAYAFLNACLNAAADEKGTTNGGSGGTDTDPDKD